jgi:hypothetical protein
MHVSGDDLLIAGKETLTRCVRACGCICSGVQAFASIRQHTSAYVSIRRKETLTRCVRACGCICSGVQALIRYNYYTSAYVSIRQHTSAYVSIRQQTSAYPKRRRGYTPQDRCCREAYALIYVLSRDMKAEARTCSVSVFVLLYQESK